MQNRIRQAISDSIQTKEKLLNDAKMLETVEQVASVCIDAYQQGRKLLFCGNGGSAADAQHLAAELSGRFYYDRPPLFAEALHVNTSFVTAVANDYSYEAVYARMVRAAGRPGDVLFAISTSGNSPNILKAIEAAKECGMIVVGLTGASGGQMRERCDYLLNMPSSDTPRIQECHMLVGHTICELIEGALFPGIP
ncbi:MAG: D-sedoheptulose 7-phosphate isomerase [Saprospiraceae bacterium]|nr:D-sedoheptulose 7-phosphate isomerase [Saprospiraceae bacterium]